MNAGNETGGKVRRLDTDIYVCQCGCSCFYCIVCHRIRLILVIRYTVLILRSLSSLKTNYSISMSLTCISTDI